MSRGSKYPLNQWVPGVRIINRQPRNVLIRRRVEGGENVYDVRVRKTSHTRSPPLTEDRLSDLIKEYANQEAWDFDILEGYHKRATADFLDYISKTHPEIKRKNLINAIERHHNDLRVGLFPGVGNDEIPGTMAVMDFQSFRIRNERAFLPKVDIPKSPRELELKINQVRQHRDQIVETPGYGYDPSLALEWRKNDAALQYLEQEARKRAEKFRIKRSDDKVRIPQDLGRGGWRGKDRIVMEFEFYGGYPRQSPAKKHSLCPKAVYDWNPAREQYEFKRQATDEDIPEGSR